MDYDYDFWTIQAMVKYGGSFVKCLGACMSHADRDNMSRIKDAFPEYVEKYEAMGQEMRFEVCSYGQCDGSGEVSCDEEDGEGHTMVGVGTRKCLCKTNES